MGTSLFWGTERATFGKPVAAGVVLNPVGDSSLLIGGNALIGMADALKDVVDVLGDAENPRSWLGDYKLISYAERVTRFSH